MKWVTRIGLLLLTLVAAAFVTGSLLPENHQASRMAVFSQPAPDVYALVSDYKNYPAWWPDVSKVEVMVEAPNRTTFREYLSDGPVIMTVVETEPPLRFVTKIDDADQPFGGTWTFEIAPLGGSRTRLTITERGEIYNPFFRVMARYVFGYTATMESFLHAAQLRLAPV